MLREVMPLNDPEYEPLVNITRCLHLREAMRAYGEKKFDPHRLKSSIAGINTKVLWFAPSQPMNKQNKYGNVSYTIPWSKAFDELGPNIYFIDQEETKNLIYTRILVTSEVHYYARKIDLNSDEAQSLFKKMFNRPYTATKARTCSTGEKIDHVLEIGFEVGAPKARWLYSNCILKANEHSLANRMSGGSFEKNVCHRYNDFAVRCPSSYPAWRTIKILRKKCPEMLNGPNGITNSHSVAQPEYESLTCDDEDESEEDDTSSGAVAKFVPFVASDSSDDEPSVRQVTYRHSPEPSYPSSYSTYNSYQPRMASASAASSYSTYNSYQPRAASTIKEEKGWTKTDTAVTVTAVAGIASLIGLGFAAWAKSNENEKKNKK